MKINILSIALMTLIALSTMVNAQDNGKTPTVKILPNQQADEIRIMYVGNTASPIRLYFKNEALDIITKDKVEPQRSAKGFVKSYDVSHLEDGEYTLEVRTKGMTKKYTFTLGVTTPIWAQVIENEKSEGNYTVKILRDNSVGYTN